MNHIVELTPVEVIQIRFASVRFIGSTVMFHPKEPILSRVNMLLKSASDVSIGSPYVARDAIGIG